MSQPKQLGLFQGIDSVNIYEHFFWNFAIFYRKPWAWKVGLGGILPDILYMVAFIPKIFSYQSFMEWMADPLWDTIWNSPIAKSAHSFVVWAAISLGLLVVLEKEAWRRFFPFLLGWGLHVLFDALTHVSDGYAIFFPLGEYRFPAPVSYWESGFHGRAYFLISHALMIALSVLWVGSKLRRYYRGKNSI